MSIIGWVTSNWDTVAAAVGVVGGLLWRRTREATRRELETWAAVALDAALLAVRHKVIPADVGAVMEEWRERLLQLADRVGVRVSPSQLSRLEATAKRRAVELGQQLLADELSKLAGEVARAAPRIDAALGRV